MKAATAYPMNSSCGVVHSFSAPRLFSERFVHCKHSGTVPALYLNDWKMDTDTKKMQEQKPTRGQPTRRHRETYRLARLLRSPARFWHMRAGGAEGDLLWWTVERRCFGNSSCSSCSSCSAFSFFSLSFL